MKNLFFVFTLIFPTLLFSQLELGFRAGLNMAEGSDLRATNGDVLEAARRNGITAGLFANIQLGKVLALQPEVTFSQKGFTASWDTSDSTSTLNASYLDMPMMLEAGFAVGNRFRVYGNVGPNVSYLLEAEQKIYDALNGESTTIPYDFSEESIERIDVGVNFGGGFSVRINRWKYSFDARYNMGLREIMATNGTQDFVDKAKHRVRSISVGLSYFVFGGKKKLQDSSKNNRGYF
ncbi:MAG: porin family protein [Bacteroidota bacterium]